MNRCTAKRRGYTLIEVVMAMLILAIMSSGVVTSLVFGSSMARINSNAIGAKNVAQGFFEQMAVDDFEDINATNYPDIPLAAEPPVWLDQAMGIRCAADFTFKGTGIAEGGTSTSIQDNDADWVAGEWVGDTIYLVDGKGAGQYGQITGNTRTTLTFSPGLTFSPDATTVYMINNGKTVEVTTRWSYRGKPYTATIESLVCNYRNSSNYGIE